MKLLGIAVALFGLVEIGVAIATGQPPVYLLAAFTLAAAFATFRAAGISTFLRLLIVYFSVETIVLGVCVSINAFGQWPDALAGARIPSTVAMTVALFSILAYLTSFVPVARKALAITDRYFAATTPAVIPLGFGRRLTVREHTIAAAALMIIILVNQIMVWFMISLTFVGADVMNALQALDSKSFWHALLIEYPIILTPYLLLYVCEFVLNNILYIRWRRWLTEDYSRRWLDRHNHYGMMLAGIGTDNPDQRIQEDIPRFINGGRVEGSIGVFTFVISLISQLSSLVGYSIILWTLSSKLTIPGTETHIPGFLLWCAIIYAAFGTGITALIGRPLAQLAFARQHFEANFRFGLARLREYGEQIALLFGETTEKSILTGQFTSIVRNFYSIVVVKSVLDLFTNFFSLISEFIPYILMAPFFFAKLVTLGDLSKTRSSFDRVSSSLTFIVTNYNALAEFKSVLDRLTTFDASLDAVPPAVALVRTPEPTTGDFVLANLQVRLPNGKPLLGEVNLRLAANENVMLTGPSGSGKSTLFRAASGVWPYQDGRVEVPTGASVMLLPQKPYLPVGTLLTAVSYPRESGFYPEEEVRAVLDAVQLGPLKGSLDIDDHWTQRLSGGEQQRLAIARALLVKPTWLFLDEATSAMDIALEQAMYEVIAERLPGTTLVSISHRETLAGHHRRHLTLTPAANGIVEVQDERLAAE